MYGATVNASITCLTKLAKLHKGANITDVFLLQDCYINFFFFLISSITADIKVSKW